MNTSLVFKTIYKLIIIAIILVIGTSSCKSKKTSSKDNSLPDQVEAENNSGFKSASIVDYSKKNAACNFLILLDEDGSILQAINIPEELRIDGIKVWITFTYSKRQQGPCPFGNPIIIDRIKLKK